MTTNLFTIRSANTGVSKNYSAIISSEDAVATVLCESRNGWQDCLTPKFSHLPLIVSERVVAAIDKESLLGLKLSEVRAEAKISINPAPRYFIAEPKGIAPDIFYRIYERDGGALCFVFECKSESDRVYQEYISNSKSTPRVQRVCRMNDFPTDFMRIPEVESGVLGFGEFLCTRRVVEIAKQQRWTNFSINPVDSLGNRFGDFLDSPWPPDLWYPDYQPLAV